MKACARYDFERKSGTATRYVLKSHDGEDIQGFPAEYRNGEKYIEFLKNTQGARFYEYGFYIGTHSGRHRRLTGVNFTGADMSRTYGDDRSIGRSDALMFEFSDDMAELSVWFLPNKAGKSREIFNLWASGAVSMKPKKKPA